MAKKHDFDKITNSMDNATVYFDIGLPTIKRQRKYLSLF